VHIPFVIFIQASRNCMRMQEVLTHPHFFDTCCKSYIHVSFADVDPWVSISLSTENCILADFSGISFCFVTHVNVIPLDRPIINVLAHKISNETSPYSNVYILFDKQNRSQTVSYTSTSLATLFSFIIIRLILVVRFNISNTTSSGCSSQLSSQ